ncbi:hypothetical protein HYW46_01995 [Candidatus Daviesbacteria bacterium]|nr:hypothetical protein [Candidatus Daviesbacteria bacterium]
MTELNQGKSPLEVVEEILRKQKTANELLVQANESGELIKTFWGREMVFHEIYIIGKVEEYHPKDRDGVHMGWAPYTH